MGTHVPGTKQVWPTRNDVATTSGDGRYFREQVWASMFAAFQEQDWVQSGFTVPASSVNLTLDVAAGVAFLKGYYVNIPVTVTVTCTASTTNYIWLELPTSSSKVTDAYITVNTSGAAPSTNAILLATAVAAIGSITSTIDRRKMTPYKRGHGKMEVIYTAGSSTWTPPAGVEWCITRKIGAGGGGGGANGGTGRGGGGGAGAEAWHFHTLTPRTPVSYQVGAGGAGGTNAPTDGSDGTDTWFDGSGNAAAGGKGGKKGNAANGNGGNGGAAPTYSSTVFGAPGKWGYQGGQTVPGPTAAIVSPGGDSKLADGGAGSAAGAGSAGTRGSGGGGAGGTNAGGAGGDGVLIIFY